MPCLAKTWNLQVSGNQTLTYTYWDHMDYIVEEAERNGKLEYLGEYKDGRHAADHESRERTHCHRH
jgi:hypothetical protein